MHNIKHMKYLPIFHSEAVVFQIELIASESGLGPSVAVELTLPLNAPEGLKLPFAMVKNPNVFFHVLI